MTKYLVVDLGGTYARFAILNQHYQIQCKHTFVNYEYPSFIEIMRHYLTLYRDEVQGITQCCVAVAGPVANNRARLTNVDWELDAEKLAQTLSFERIELINDFHSLGFCIPLLQAENLLSLQAGHSMSNDMKVILGAGTGLGVAFVKHDEKNIMVYPSEGGHVDFAPVTRRQVRLLEFLMQKYQHVSVEHALSGHGIEHIYEFICQEKGEIDSLHEDYVADDISGQKVIKLAMEQEQPAALEAIELFSEIYAAFIGNVALQMLPYGGIYITGGVARHILPFLQHKNFLNAYHAKGRISAVLKNIPVHYILNPNASLLGAGYYMSFHAYRDQSVQTV